MRGKCLAIAVCAALCVSGFAAVPCATGQTSDDLYFRVAIQDDIKSLNPLVAGDVWSWDFLGWIYDPAIRSNTTKLQTTDIFGWSEYSEYQLLPYIATHTLNYTESEPFRMDDSSVWESQDIAGQCTVFYDFANVTFHDGHQMDIEDILFSYGVQAAIPDWASEVKPLMDRGGEAGSNYSGTHWLGIKKMSDTTLRFYLQAPYADFIRNTLSVFILPQHIWGMKVGGQDVDNADPYLPPSNPNYWNPTKAIAFSNSAVIGSGPFKFQSWTPGIQAKLETYDNYFYERKPYIDGITFRVFKTAEQAVQALLGGYIDYIAWSIPPTYVPDILKHDDLSIQQVSERGFFYMAYNMRRQSFGYNETGVDVGKPLRRAIAQCVDKKQIVQRLLQNFGIPGDSPVSPLFTVWYNNSLPQFNYNTSMAMHLLDVGADGVDGTADDYRLTDPSLPPGFGNWWLNPDGTPIGSIEGGVIEILTPPADYDPIRAQAGCMIANDMCEIGINARSIPVDFGTIVTRLDSREFDMYILGWRIGPDPTDFFYSFFHSSNADVGPNYPGYRNETQDQLLNEARLTSNQSLRIKLIMEAQAAIAYDQPYTILYFRTNINVVCSGRFYIPPNCGEIMSWNWMLSIRPPLLHNLKAWISGELDVEEGSQTKITVAVRDEDRMLVEGATVMLGSLLGNVSQPLGVTPSSGFYTTTFTAPEVNETQTVPLSLVGASLYGYGDAPGKYFTVRVHPREESFLRVRLELGTSIIEEGEQTALKVEVVNQDGVAVDGALVVPSADIGMSVEPSNATTDDDGLAWFNITSSQASSYSKTITVNVTKESLGCSVGYIGLYISEAESQVTPPDQPPVYPILIVTAVAGAIVASVAVLYFIARSLRRR